MEFWDTVWHHALVGKGSNRGTCRVAFGTHSVERLGVPGAIERVGLGALTVLPSFLGLTLLLVGYLGDTGAYATRRSRSCALSR